MKYLSKFLFIITFFVFALTMHSCMSYYQKMSKFQGFAEMGDFEKADKVLTGEKNPDEGRNRFLYFANMGWTQHMLGDEKQSNVLLNRADDYIENFERNYAMDALSMLTNPTVKPYQPETIENTMLNYYKAMNYLQLNDREGALVEARKITQKLYEQKDKYKDKQDRYSDDAFAHILIGLIYDASGDYNNAFIAYRNADKAFDNIYSTQFELNTPLQLKQDLLRTASLSGMNSELDRFERKYQMKYTDAEHEAQLVFFWENGFGPVKDQWSINFTKIGSSGGFVTFTNEEMGLTFPIYIGHMSSQEKTGFSELEIFRIAFPKYVERERILNTAQISFENKEYPLYLAEDINAISFKVLNDRMLRELATSVARFAAKKATEAAVRSQNQDIGTAVGILNALTETADTRNWQTLPSQISYCRIPLKTGDNNLIFSANGNGKTEKQNLNLHVTKGQTIFFNYRSLMSQAAKIQ
jgi:hypothetical protein